MTSITIGDTTVLASDGQCSGRPSFQGFSLSFTARDAAEAEQRFTALAEDGQVQLPLGKTFFAERFGMATASACRG
jgi:PhnB protein